VPDNALLPIAKLNKALVAAMRNLPAGGTSYDDVQGNQKLRKNIARWSFTWGSGLEADDIVTTAGAMSAISYCLMAITKAGDSIAVESPVYFATLQLAKSLGLKVIELPTNPVTGIEPGALKKVLPRIKACILVSNFSNPTGACIPEENKKAIVQMLIAANVPLIEDDLYGDVYFGSSRPKPCKAFDEVGMVLWCGSVSKTLAPGYRVGWVAPGRFREKIIRIKLLHSISSTTLTQEVIADFLENARYENHLRRLRSTLYANSLRFIRAISEYFPEGTRVTQPTGGFVLWAEMDKTVDTALLYELAIQDKISIAPGRMFTLQNQFNNCMRLSYGLNWNDQLDKKLQHLGQLVKSLSQASGKSV
jgi:DNA-binding transcriptional MocR family regulator